MLRTLLVAALGAAVPVAAAYGGLSLALGAHPFWATQIALIGAPVGFVAALVLARVPYAPGAAALLTAVAYAVATIGKNRFAASFAEDTLAGQMWYFGWIATAAALGATLALLALRRLAGRPAHSP